MHKGDRQLIHGSAASHYLHHITIRMNSTIARCLTKAPIGVRTIHGAAKKAVPAPRGIVQFLSQQDQDEISFQLFGTGATKQQD